MGRHGVRFVWRRTAGAALALASVTSGCAVGERPVLTDETVPAAVSLSPSPQPDPEVTIAFAGDVHFTERTAALLDDPPQAFGPVARVLSAADLAMVNLETAITTRGTPEPKSFHFRAPPSAFAAVRSAGVDVVSMANNHAVDYGPVGLEDTFAAIASTGFPVVGLGRDAEQAYAPWYTEAGRQRVAIIGASQVRDHTLSAWTAEEDSPGIASAHSASLVESVVEADARADVVVVYLHWGQEGNGCPTQSQQELARRLTQAGADAIVGTHAHLLLGGGWLDRAYVAYGLGNFVWWRDQAFSNDTGVLTLTFRDGRAVEAVFTPAVIDSDGRPIPVDGDESARVLAEWDRVRGCAELASTPPS